MSDAPWLTIIGLGEDGPDGLPPASLAALEAAEIVMGPPRHLALLPELKAERIEWPVPFADGLPILLALRGRAVAVLASGDPFWHGAGSTITQVLTAGEWRSLPGLSCFSLAAARLGWPLESTICLANHAAPFSRLRPHLAPGARIIATLRDGAAVAALADYLRAEGFGPSRLVLLEALGGPRERITEATAESRPAGPFAHPLVAAIAPQGGKALTLTSGRPNDLFANDGQITKRIIRALTLSSLAPRPGEHLWDIGGGSGSIAIEWLLAHPSLKATSIEADPGRAARIRENAGRLGVDRLEVIEGRAPEALAGLAAPDAIFIGGGLSAELLETVEGIGARIVANAVTLESEALLADANARLGGSLLRIELSEAAPLGRKRGWKAAYPVVQWSCAP
ncbi:precorrin-6y C5,15-methyltransferase (decarboxylating) subunit CbiE [Sedimentitalea sp. JM2-8]|uniref:Precorrin-6y C5,15-methyltransferase (Decarboxylating) subunit CbiE n=1 Tax=Sedimentitalea xiamensis TaxID=3050037 RepID=A0ABT7FHD5_9RHOB|nr:precorrin-6y C5,15-methyltransferase (decarboxylating) subunit CbiE [Sedimentitalea xiamensis]MDK3074502.1 precorrin-6y C5,15-methyltransferase (decarboxylating) subunit CbiE [Sedimentitalea xiamensis]